MKRGSAAGTIMISRTLPSPFFSSKISESPLFGMNGKGMRRIDRLRGKHREDLLAEMLVEPFPHRLVERLVADHVHARRVRFAWRPAHTSC